MIKNIVFDVGNVLVGWDWWGKVVYALFDKETADAVTHAVDDFGDWNEFDRGVLSEDEIVNNMIAHDPSLEKEIRLSVERSRDALLRYDYAIPWIKELKAKGYKTYYLSNYSYRLMDQRPDVLDFLEYLDGGIFSCKVKATKPEPEIYQALLDTYHLNSEECFFMDDMPRNLEGAAKFGIHTYHFIDYATCHDEIMKMLEEDRRQ